MTAPGNNRKGEKGVSAQRGPAEGHFQGAAGSWRPRPAVTREAVQRAAVLLKMPLLA